MCASLSTGVMSAMLLILYAGEERSVSIEADSREAGRQEGEGKDRQRLRQGLTRDREWQRATESNTHRERVRDGLRDRYRVNGAAWRRQERGGK